MRLQFRLLGVAGAIEALQFVCGVLTDVLDEVVDLAATIVADRGVAFAFRQPEEGREAADVKRRRHVISGGIHLHDGNLFSLQLLAQLIEDWSKFLAVTAPWSCKQLD